MGKQIYIICGNFSSTTIIGFRVNNEDTSFQEHVFTSVVKCLNLSFFII